MAKQSKKSESSPFHIKKGLLGERVHYRCPKCSADLESKLDEIGNPDFCPICGIGFTVPGIDEMKRRAEEKERAKRQIVPVQRQPKEFFEPIEPRKPEKQQLAELDREIEKVILQPNIRVKIGTVECPFCSEPIQATAKKCKHCGEFVIDVESEDVKARAMSAKSTVTGAGGGVVVNNNINIGQPLMAQAQPKWNAGVAALLSLLLPGVGQMYKGQVLNGLAWMFFTVIGYISAPGVGFIIHIACIAGAASGDPTK